MATAAELARRNAAAMEGFRSSLRGVREGAATRAGFHAAEAADLRHERFDRQREARAEAADLRREARAADLAREMAEANRRAQTINSILGILGGMAQTWVSSAVQAGQQRAADDRRAQSAIDLQNLQAQHARDLQAQRDDAVLNRQRLADERQVMRDYSKYLREWQAPETPAAAAEPLPEPRSSIFDPEYKESIMRSDVQAGWEGVEPLLREVGLTNEFTENYAGFMGEGDTPEDGQRKWRDAAVDRTKHAFWSAFGEIVVDNPDVLNDSGEATREDIEAWNKALGAGNWDEAERLLGNNSSLVAFRNFVYGPPTTVDEPASDADPKLQSLGEILAHGAGSGGADTGGTSAVAENWIATGEGTLTDLALNALGGVYVPSSGEDHDPIPATERSDRAKDALVLAENEGNLTGEESRLVPQLIQFADHLQELESLNELQAARGEESQHDLARDWFELEKWIQEIEQPGDEFENVDNWRMHQGRAWPRERSGDVAVRAIEGQLGARIDNLRLKLPTDHPLRRHTTTLVPVIGGAGMPRTHAWSDLYEPE